MPEPLPEDDAPECSPAGSDLPKIIQSPTIQQVAGGFVTTFTYHAAPRAIPKRTGAELELIVNDQVRVRVPAGFDPETLRQVLRVLKVHSQPESSAS